MELKIYDLDGNFKRSEIAKETDLWFGTVRNLMQLIKINDISNSAELLKAVCGAWEEITIILSDAFPTITEEEWDRVKAKDVVNVVYSIMQKSFGDILNLENISKN